MGFHYLLRYKIYCLWYEAFLCWCRHLIHIRSLNKNKEKFHLHTHLNKTITEHQCHNCINAHKNIVHRRVLHNVTGMFNLKSQITSMDNIKIWIKINFYHLQIMHKFTRTSRFPTWSLITSGKQSKTYKNMENIRGTPKWYLFEPYLPSWHIDIVVIDRLSKPRQVSLVDSNCASRMRFFCFILLFWNQIFTCVSLSPNEAAISILLALVKYLLKWNSFSSSVNCLFVKFVLPMFGCCGVAMAAAADEGG